MEVEDQSGRLIQSRYTDTGPTSPGTDPIHQDRGRVAVTVPMFKSVG